MRTLPLLVLASFLFAACSGTTEPTDAGTDGSHPDGSAHDAGVAPDTGVTTDAGTPDSGLAPDTGVSSDSGTTTDSGPADDAGTTTDSGTMDDAGTTGTDAGTTADSGGGGGILGSVCTDTSMCAPGLLCCGGGAIGLPHHCTTPALAGGCPLVP